MKYTKTREVRSPNRGTPGSAGIDFYIPVGFDQKIGPGCSALVPTGIKVNIPDSTMLQVCNKSSIAVKKGLLVGAEIIDFDYQGEIFINVWNVSNLTVTLTSGSKLAQLILVPILFPTLERVEEENLYEEITSRGDGALGSTGA
jgi:dUTP pyrophosphatase|tara:strand:+ start:623 stop:1054 length:432 start_codon:yes stop_codon:yes gene_type:complete